MVIVEVNYYVCTVCIVKFTLIRVRVVQRGNVESCRYTVSLIWQHKHKLVQGFIDPKKCIGASTVQESYRTKRLPDSWVSSVKVDSQLAFVDAWRRIKRPVELYLASNGITKTCSCRIVKGVGWACNWNSGVGIVDLEYLWEIVFVLDIARSKVCYTDVKLVIVIRLRRSR